ncbi:MAG: hypothetical protein ACTSR2_01055 [Candidatus Hodarchaeales archaeon]
MFQERQLDNIKIAVLGIRRRTKAKEFIAHFGEITKEELKQVQQLFPKYKVEKAGLGYLKFIKKP